MTPTHRPLSAWVAHLTQDASGIGLVNDGDDRADAREMEYFADGWHRTAVPVGGEPHALGLTHGGTGATVVELDDIGVPMSISPQALAVIDRVEHQWPRIDGVLAEDFPLLGDEPLPVRYWLLERLDAEGDPPDEVFAILPWELLDRAVDTVVVAVESGGGELGAVVEIRHWLTPAVRGLTGSLEQLDHGVRIGDGRIARLGASALLTNLRDIPVSRIPDQSREKLSRLVTVLGRLDPLYRHVSGVVKAHLTGVTPVSRIRTELHSNLEAAADTGDGVREHVENLGDDTQQIHLTETRAGWVRLTAQVERVRTVDGPFAERTGAFLPVRIVPRDDRTEQQFWIPLYPEGDHLVGSINVALPRGWSEFDADDAPIGADELEFADPAALVPSLYASSAPSAQHWLDIAAGLPVNHAMRIAARQFEDSL